MTNSKTMTTRRSAIRGKASLAVALLAGVLASAAAAQRIAPMSFDRNLYADLLARHTHAVADVAGTRVDYAALGSDPEWKRLLDGLAAAVEPTRRDERLAFWIDAYNVLAMDVVARHRPIASIRDVGSLLRPVWKRDAGVAAGAMRTLDEIEHDILRPMGEPRIHMAIVCASTSCPSLAREPFRPETLDSQLDAAARAFVANRDKGARVEAGGLRVSSIFQWFEEDFAASGGVPAFIRRHADAELAAAIDRLGPSPRLSYLDYDWSLNGSGR
jgi:hypothetical protein